MSAGAVRAPLILPLRLPFCGKTKNQIDTSTQIDISSSTPGVQLYFTIDGSRPNPATYKPRRRGGSTYLFRNPFTLPAGARTVKAVAVQPGTMRESNVVTKTFDVAQSDVAESGENCAPELRDDYGFLEDLRSSEKSHFLKVHETGPLHSAERPAQNAHRTGLTSSLPPPILKHKFKGDDKISGEETCASPTRRPSEMERRLCPTCGSLNPVQMTSCLTCEAALPQGMSSLINISSLLPGHQVRPTSGLSMWSEPTPLSMNTRPVAALSECRVCHRQNSADARFCDRCGTKDPCVVSYQQSVAPPVNFTACNTNLNSSATLQPQKTYFDPAMEANHLLHSQATMNSLLEPQRLSQPVLGADNLMCTKCFSVNTIDSRPGAKETGAKKGRRHTHCGPTPNRNTTTEESGGSDPTDWECHKGHIKKEPLQPDSVRQSADSSTVDFNEVHRMLHTRPPSEPVSCLMWEWAHWLTCQRTRLRAPQHNLAPITHTPVFTYSGDMEQPSPSDSQSTGQPLDTQNIQWADGVVWCKRQIGSLPSHGF
ncbi:unnamed protein product [Schistocephalus solidus]|uniref:DZANK-type domain-containing protein n=1 Tax=Schistocephalus solidus TaxID=70667 RepID=A0A183S7P6_SCHSO|nr:unnamed protein product [Schistocephalus solidus]